MLKHKLLELTATLTNLYPRTIYHFCHTRSALTHHRKTGNQNHCGLKKLRHTLPFFSSKVTDSPPRQRDFYPEISPTHQTPAQNALRPVREPEHDTVPNGSLALPSTFNQKTRRRKAVIAERHRDDQH